MYLHLAKSHEGRDVVAYANGVFAVALSQGRVPESLTLLIGGTHGDERATVTLLERFSQKKDGVSSSPQPVAIISLLNPDGFARNSRYNARGIDLNRNFPHRWNPNSQEPPGPAPLSEPESRALFDFILKFRPSKIVSLHWALAELDADGPQSIGLARTMWDCLSADEKLAYRLRLPPTLSAPAPTPAPATEASLECSGSLGQWCGYGNDFSQDQKPAIVTLELPYQPHLSRPEILPDDHLHTVQTLWECNPKVYLDGVEDPVHRMLEAACKYANSPKAGTGR